MALVVAAATVAEAFPTFLPPPTSPKPIPSIPDLIATLRTAQTGLTQSMEHLQDGGAVVAEIDALLQSLPVNRSNRTTADVELLRASHAATLAAQSTAQLALDAAIADLGAIVVNIVGYALVASGIVVQAAAFGVASRGAAIRVQLAAEALDAAEKAMTDSLNDKRMTDLFDPLEQMWWRAPTAYGRMELSFAGNQYRQVAHHADRTMTEVQPWTNARSLTPTSFTVSLPSSVRQFALAPDFSSLRDLATNLTYSRITSP